MADVTAKTLSEYLGIGVRRIQQLAKTGVLTKAKRGKYPLKASIQAYIDFLRTQITNTGKAKGTLNEETARLKHAQANLAEMEEAERRGQLLDAEIVYKEGFAFARTIRDAMLTIPDRIAPELVKEDSQQKTHLKLYQEIEKSIGQVVAEMEKNATNKLEELKQTNSKEKGEV